VEISDGAIIKWNSELGAKVVNKSNIQSEPPSIVTPYYVTVLLIILALFPSKNRSWVHKMSMLLEILIILVSAGNLVFLCQIATIPLNLLKMRSTSSRYSLILVIALALLAGLIYLN
jgi:hypothetical protein